VFNYIQVLVQDIEGKNKEWCPVNQLCCWTSAVEVAVKIPEFEGGWNGKGKVGMRGMVYHRREIGVNYLFGGR
jgi:hypothetical protein